MHASIMLQGATQWPWCLAACLVGSLRRIIGDKYLRLDAICNCHASPEVEMLSMNAKALMTKADEAFLAVSTIVPD